VGKQIKVHSLSTLLPHLPHKIQLWRKTGNAVFNRFIPP